MKEKGFTLIELLAVIVILAIIALIATPIILGIINDARVESQERSAELYLSAVDLAVVKRNMTEEFSPEECTITEGVVTCTGYEDPLNVEIDGETPVSGTIKFENNKVTTGTTLTFSDFTATLNEENKIEVGKIEESGEKFEIGKLSSVCEPAETQYFEDTPMEPGYEYNCKVDPNAEPYTFYVLNKTDNQVNLIMDRNINSNGSVAIDRVNKTENENEYNVLGFDPHSYYEEITGKSCEENGFDCDLGVIYTLGPINFMRFLDEATANWTNLNAIEISTFEKENSDGKTFSTNNLGETYTTYARLPKATEINNYDSSTGAYAYLYDNLLVSTKTFFDTLTWDNFETLVHSESSIGTDDMLGVHVDGIEHTNNSGYNLETIGYDDDSPRFYVGFSGVMANGDPSFASILGIRPVITLDIQ